MWFPEGGRVLVTIKILFHYCIDLNNKEQFQRLGFVKINVFSCIYRTLRPIMKKTFDLQWLYSHLNKYKHNLKMYSKLYQGIEHLIECCKN